VPDADPHAADITDRYAGTAIAPTGGTIRSIRPADWPEVAAI
jgi:hypothetical protein